MQTELIAGFLFGLLGSFHCAGMCGPLVLALPLHSNFLASRIIHNTGRIITYGLFGLLFGLIGSGLYIAGFQQIITITIGIIIIISVALPYKIKSKFIESSGINKLLLILKLKLGSLYKSRSKISIFGIGMLNGLLPCGFVYMALPGALIIGNVYGSALFMLAFGLGTVPVMIAVSVAGKIISVNIRDKIRKLVPVFSFIIAVLFILRGLNLGIPYISPKLENPKNNHANFICG